MTEYYYRFEDYRSEYGTRLRLCRYEVIKHTPQGVWIKYLFGKKFILSNTHKKFACTSIKEAKESFKARKDKQLRILKGQILQVEQSLEALKEWKEDDMQSFTSCMGSDMLLLG